MPPSHRPPRPRAVPGDVGRGSSGAEETPLDPGLLRPVRPVPTPAIAAPLDLAKAPFVLSSLRLPGVAREGGDEEDVPEAETDERDAEALDRLPELPPEAWQAQYETVESFGRRVRVRVQGHSRLGMPRGRDLDVFLGVLSLYAADYQAVLAGRPSRQRDGALLDVSVNEILGAMGVPADDRNGTASRRVRQALRRFGFVTLMVSGRRIRDTRAEAAALLAGAPGARPIVPDRRPAGRGAAGEAVAEVDEEVLHLLEYRWQISYARTPAGELRISHLRLHPRLLDHLVTGWVAWIDADRYRALSSPLARRLYVLLAGEAATGRPTPWEFDLRALRAACGMSPHRYANEVKKDVLRASDELARQSVLAGIAEAKSPRKGEWTLVFEPGPALILAALLRGTSVLDLSSERAQIAFLQYFGFDAAAARRLVSEHPNGVHDALCFALYVRETQPSRVARSWPGFILDRVTSHRPNSGEVGYAEWAAKRLVPEAEREAAHGASPPAPAAPAMPEPAPVAPPVRIPAEPEAAAAWGALRGALPENAVQDAIGRTMVDHLVPLRIDGETLVLGTELLWSRSTMRQVRRALDSALEGMRAVAGGPGDAPSRVRIDHIDAGRDGTTLVVRALDDGTSGEDARDG